LKPGREGAPLISRYALHAEELALRIQLRRVGDILAIAEGLRAWREVSAATGSGAME
jgi:hypothetical protein